MATTEADTLFGGSDASSGGTYDGFISYSHAADDLLAPRLQAGLQRFAKPWWKRRALRIFRDESSLSANPHLWSSIVEALDGSEWFVLLLSPNAAASSWVNQEIEYWTKEKDPSRILPVLTDGTFDWVGSDVAGTAVPEELTGVFEEEPRWVDLRFARDEEQLDLKDPRFADAAADIASALRGIPKDELASEEVKQHRRTVRTAWAAGIVVLLLGVAASVGAVVAVNQSNEAEVQRDEARRQTNEAFAQAKLARSQELAAASASVLESDPELASLLAVLSLQKAPGDPPAESLRALRKADQANYLRLRIPFDGLSYVGVSPDGESVIAVSLEREIASFALDDGRRLWQTSVGEHLDEIISMAVSPSGSEFVVTGLEASAETGVVLVFSVADGSMKHSVATECPPGWWSGARPFSPDGTVLALGTGNDACNDSHDDDWISFLDTNTWEEVAHLEIPGWQESGAFSDDGSRFTVMDVSGGSNRIEIRSFPALDVVQTYEASFPIPCCAAVSPTNETIATDRGSTGLSRTALFDFASGDLLGYAEGQGHFLSGTGTAFSPDGKALLVTSRDGKVLVDANDGRLLSRLGSTEAAFDVSFGPDGDTIVTSGEDRIEVWDLGDRSGTAGLHVDDVSVAWINPDRLLEGPNTAVHGFVGTLGVDSLLQVLVIDETTGETMYSTHAANSAQLPDGRFVVVEQTPTGTEMGRGRQPNHSEAVVGGLSVWNPESDELASLADCSVLLSETDEFSEDPTTQCDNGEPVFGAHVYGTPVLSISPDGESVAASSQVLSDGLYPCAPELESHRMVRVWRVSTGEVVVSIEIDGCEELSLLGDGWVLTYGLDLQRGGSVYSVPGGELLARLPFPGARWISELTPDGRFIITAGGTIPTALIVDTSNWSVFTRWDAHPSQIRGVAISPKGDRLATSGEDGTTRIWSLESLNEGTLTKGQGPLLLDEIPTAIVSDIRWIDDQTLGVVHRGPAAWQIISLDPEEVVNGVLNRLNRSFTDIECQAYRIDPCPTLDELWER